MVRKIDAFWRPPQFENIELTWRARPTYLMARSLLLITLVTTLAAGLLPPNKPAGPVIGLTIAFILLLSMVLVRRGHVGFVNWAMPGLVLLAAMTALWLGYLPVDLALAVTVITVAIGSFMTSLLGGLIFGAAASVVMSLALFLHAPSRLDVTGIHSPALESLIYVFLLLATILLVRLMDRVMWSGYREWRLQATMLERANRELAITIDSMQVQSASLAKANRDLQSEIVERRQAQQLLRAVVDGTAAVTGADFMRSLVKYLAEALAVPYVFVGEALDLDPCRVRALAFWNDGAPGPLFEYCIPGTPCQEVVSRGETIYIPQGVRELYPEDMDLVELRSEGYFGTPLVTMAGGVIGNLVLMDRIPLLLDEQKQSLVKVFAARASAELERQHAEAALELERSLLAQRVDERTAELRTLNTELSRISQRKDEFLASMSHDLRTPLNSVIGMAESLQDGVYGPIGERQVKAATVIEASGRHLLDLINDVLDVSKIEAGQLLLAMSTVDVDALCRACLAFVGAAAQHKRISIDYTCGPDVPDLVADERRLKQVLINLLGNAVKFTDDGGQVGLRVQNLPANDSIEFVVWDTGIGIDPQQIDRLFRPFVQIDTGLNRKQGGTGLGLSIVKRLVEMHGGTVTVESQVNAGSRFLVVLPNGVNSNCPETSSVISLPPAAGE